MTVPTELDGAKVLLHTQNPLTNNFHFVLLEDG
jgi:hypothetical protein